ncbi:MAG: hypothetical protein BMS9Abin11_0210 [Gammaproteobacteria bacterium]|nr:MAG: hypothetical protein BMS9Abin11_0210 [Gammaproteobacteria bacterium]
MIKCLQMVVYGLLVLVLSVIFFPVFAEESGTGSATATGTTGTETTTGTSAKPAVRAAPALSPLQKAYKRNRQLRQDLRETRGKLATQTARIQSLEKKLLQKNIKPVVDDVEFANSRRASRVREPEATSFTEVFAGFSWLWLLFSFAMLIIGFWAGVVWLREHNRKKLGGMHLRV